MRLRLWKQGHCSAQGDGGTGQGSGARTGRACWCNLESGLGSRRGAAAAAMMTGVAQETRAQARSCGCAGAVVAVLGRCGSGYWRLKLRLLEAQGFGGNWNEGVWSSPSPFYKPVEQLNGLGSRRVTISLL